MNFFMVKKLNHPHNSKEGKFIIWNQKRHKDCTIKDRREQNRTYCTKPEVEMKFI